MLRLRWIVLAMLVWQWGMSVALASQMTLTWTNPTTNTDGSPLTDLSAIVVYWRADPLLSWESIGEVGPVTSVVIEPVFVGNYTVRARNVADIESANSNLVNVKRPHHPTITDAVIRR